MGVLKLRGLRVRLQFVCLASLVFVSKQAAWYLVKYVLKYAGVALSGVLGLLNGSFELLDFRLRGLIRELALGLFSVSI